jgi:hypothetical protein
VELPTLYNGFTEADIRSRVLKLGELAKKMRERSYYEGRLTIQQPVPRFYLDSNLMPTKVSAYLIRDSNRYVITTICNDKLDGFWQWHMHKLNCKGSSKSDVLTHLVVLF